MKHLKKFNEERIHQLDDVNGAREVLSKIYDIKDEVKLGRLLTDFLVPLDQFIEYADKYDGYVAGNRFNSLKEFKSDIEDKLESVISPIIYIAPFWFTRSVDDILKFGDVYSDTIYVQLTGFVSDFSVEEQEVIKDSIGADECFLRKSESGKVYLRIWWD